MTNSQTAKKLRSKKLGVLIRDARLAAGKEIQDCAGALDVPAGRFEAFELGQESPSLPQLEQLASYLNLPLERFWSDKALSAGNGHRQRPGPRQVVGLRMRVIGALLRKARLDAGLSLQDLAEQAELSVELLEAFELGQQEIPLPELEALSSMLGRQVGEFRANVSAPSAPRSRAGDMAPYGSPLADLPLDLQEFILKPVNRPYLELAVRLSQMPADELRSVAEALLAITF